MGRVHVVTVDSSEVLYLPGGGDAVDLKKRCEARDAQSSGSPSSLVFDETEALFVADFAKRAIISQRPAQPDGEEERFEEFDILVGDYEGKPFCGPNSLAFDGEGNLFFTDSGPMGETSLEKPRGSVFCVEVADQLLKPLALQCMAHPSGVAVSADGKVVYVAETMANRIVRFVKQKHGVFLSSVFHQFSGGFGPTALSLVTDPETNGSYLLVARFDFGAPVDPEAEPIPSQAEGSIAVIKENGELLRQVSGPAELGPEITGLLVAPHADTDPAQSETAKGLTEQSVYITSSGSHKLFSVPLVNILQLE
eukprot:Tamp_09159.p1 GENE.Tamp_09159~~Tamp_09159.p1  ORF type:complete len:349 (+),score=80.71 Tamp_09159:123-1049(+)